MWCWTPPPSPLPTTLPPLVLISDNGAGLMVDTEQIMVFLIIDGGTEWWESFEWLWHNQRHTVTDFSPFLFKDSGNRFPLLLISCLISPLITERDDCWMWDRCGLPSRLYFTVLYCINIADLPVHGLSPRPLNSSLFLQSPVCVCVTCLIASCSSASIINTCLIKLCLLQVRTLSLLYNHPTSVSFYSLSLFVTNSHKLCLNQIIPVY